MKSKIVDFWKKRLVHHGGSIRLNDPFHDLAEEMQQNFPEWEETAPRPEKQQEKQTGAKGIKHFRAFVGKAHKNPLINSPAINSNIHKARFVAAMALGMATGVIISVGLGVWFDMWQAADDDEIALLEGDVQIVPPPPAGPVETVHTVILGEIRPGDTLANIMVAAGASQRDTYLATTSFNKVFSVRKLKPGQKTSIRLLEGAEGPLLEEFVLEPDQKRKVITTRQGDDEFETIVEELPLVTTLKVTHGTIDSSLYATAMAAGMPVRLLTGLVNIFSFDVDFQREIQKGDSFSLMYESMQDETGREIETGQILVAEMILSGAQYKYYRFKPEDDFADYYTAKGQSARKALLRTPIDGARISSGFGTRRHPILGYTRLHQGADFAAPRGTPIYAAGDGIVESAGWNGNYGKYVRIRHDGTYKTAYAHMHQLAKGISKGKRVRQRQVIGYVGSSGRSTGNHLHFEVHKNNRPVNPLSVKLPTGRKLNEQEMEEFEKMRAELDQRYQAEQSARSSSIDPSVPTEPS